MIMVGVRRRLREKRRMKRGTIFCQVDRTKHIGHEMLDITEGNQKWHGGRPNFTRRPAIIMDMDMEVGMIL